MAIPSDLPEELDRELHACSHTLKQETDRLAALIELNRRALSVSLRLGRPATVHDLLVADEDPQDRLVALLQSLRDVDRARNGSQQR